MELEAPNKDEVTSSTSVSFPTYSWASLKAATKLATGTTTVIYSARLLGTPVAAKLLRENTSEIPDTTAASDLRKETVQNSRLRHPNIVQFLGLVTSPKLGDPQGLIFELATEGKLKCKTFGPSRLGSGVEIAICVARALTYAHDRGILHRDVKPSQVLLFANRVAKLGDWGLSRSMDNSVYTGETGTWEYVRVISYRYWCWPHLDLIVFSNSEWLCYV